MRGDSQVAGFPQPIYDRRKIANPGRPPRFFSENYDAQLDSFIARRTQPENEVMHETRW